MKIEAAHIEMRSRHTLSKTSATRIEFNDLFNQRLEAPRNETKTRIKSLIAEIIAGLQEFLADRQIEFQRRYLFEKGDNLVIKLPAQADFRQILDRLLELLSGRQIPHEVQRDTPAGWLIVVIPGSRPSGGRVLPQANFEQFRSQRQDFYREVEKLSFSAEGTIMTSDHRRIQFGSQWEQLREYVNITQAQEPQANVVDPLVLNFHPQLASLTPQKFDFDLNSDGETEQISLVNPESGFLALDLDHDLKITQGKELFGPSTGNGFLELKNYDSDHNGWIDEADPVFQELKIWNKDASGNDQLSTLSEKGVGAILLENISAPFEHKDQSNQLLGQSRRAGIFIREDGEVGTVQEIELTV